MNTARRYVRAFIGAVRMTLRGEKPPTDQEVIAAAYPTLSAWMGETIRLAAQVENAINTAGMDSATLIVNVDKRRTNAKTILDTVRFHHAEEYPYMLKNQVQHSLTGIHATNLNDRYVVLMLSKQDELHDAIRGAVSRLRDHLDNMPSA